MHSRLLRHFLGVVEKRNITAAAEALHISQPALTRSIRQLEKTIGVPLFERLPTGVALTKQGEVLARRVKLMELEYRHALSEISALEQGVTGMLRIGAGPMWVSAILPGIVTAFHQQFPKVKVRLTEGAIDSIVPALLAGEIDLACVTLSFPSQPELVKEPLVNVRQALVARAGHPLAGKGTVKAEDWRVFPGSCSPTTASARAASAPTSWPTGSSRRRSRLKRA
jgi:DNA-binding transcriptional LysR family regulator